MNSFSASHRQQLLDNLQKESFDLIIIGGGITGAGIALDAQSRGMKVALVEMQDFAAGTSSRSTKLIHGGLRYLKNLEFKLVAEVGRERAIVYENGPHITKAEPMLLPIVKNGSLGKFSAGLGVWLYDKLAGVQKNEQRKMLSASQTLIAEPMLKSDLVSGGIIYYEYRTDDARLTIEVLKKSVELGAVAVNYVKVENFSYSEGQVSGVKLVDQLTGKAFSAKSKMVVNATGPWVDTLLGMDDSQKSGRLFVTKGVHLVVDHSNLPVKQSAYFDVGDGRMIFVIPRDGKTYIGTTDTAYSDDFKNPIVKEEDVIYLLNAVNRLFVSFKLERKDIESCWVGLRPLIREEGKSASEISRKDEIFINASGLISIAGGKLTGYRKMAQKIVDIVSKRIKSKVDIKLRDCQTRRIKLSGGDVGGALNFKSYVTSMIALGKKAGFSDLDSRYIAEHYGTNSKLLFDIAEKGREEAISSGLPLKIYAQLIYAIDYEMTISPSDFFIRRTGMLYFDIALVLSLKEPVMLLMKKRIQWRESMEKYFKGDLENQIEIASFN